MITYQAIETKLLPATNTKGIRIKAFCARGSFAIPYDHSLDLAHNHRAAALALVAKFVREDNDQYGPNNERNPWARPLVTGSLPSGNYVHVFGEEKK
jgi:hypothetical protein